MTIDEIISYLTDLGSVVVQRPSPGDGTPELAWGDVFFHYAPAGELRPHAQPFATIVTKDYPGDDRCRLDRPGAYRVNIQASREDFRTWIGRAPRDLTADDPGSDDTDLSTPDRVIAHPVYGSLGWLAVVNPGDRTAQAVRDLLRAAHRAARNRQVRRAGH